MLKLDLANAFPFLRKNTCADLLTQGYRFATDLESRFMSEAQPFDAEAIYLSEIRAVMRGKKKWSDRMADCFQSSGQIWDDASKAAAKGFIAAAVATSPKKALNPVTRKPFDALVVALEERISALGTSRNP